MLGTAIAELLVKIGADSVDFEKGLSSAERKFKKFAEKIVETGKTMSMTITAPIIAVGTAATKMAMDAVESENLFDVSMGKMADSARQWSEQMRNELGLNAYEVRKNVGTFNVMLKSMGLTEEKAYEMAKGLTKLAYDMASFYNLKPEEAFEKLQSGISGEVEPLKRLGIIVNETTAQTYAYANGIAAQGAALTEQEKILARYGAIMQQTSAAQGDLARTMDSPANQARVLESQIAELAVQFGQMLIPMLKTAMGHIQTFVNWLKGLDTGGRRTVVTILMVVAAIGPLLIAIGKVPAVFYSAVSGVKALSNAFTFLAKNPIVIVIAAAVALGYGIYKLIQHFRNSTEATIKNTDKAIENAKAKQTQIEKAKSLAQEYTNLQQKNNKTNVDLARMNVILIELNGIMPGLVSNGQLVAGAFEKMGAAAAKMSAELRQLEMTKLQLEILKVSRELGSAQREYQRVVNMARPGSWYWDQLQSKRDAAALKVAEKQFELAQKQQELYTLQNAPTMQAAQDDYNRSLAEQKKQTDDAKAAEDTLYEVRLRNASEIDKLEMERQKALSEAKGPEHKKAINADYDDRVLALKKKQAEEEAELEKKREEEFQRRLEEDTEKVRESLAKKKAYQEAEMQGYEKAYANTLAANGQAEEAELQEAINTYNRGYRELQEAQSNGEPVYNRWLALYSDYEKSKLEITKKYADERARIEKDAEQKQIQADQASEQSNVTMWGKAIEVLNNYRDRLIGVMFGESAVRLAQLDRAHDAEQASIKETVKDEQLKASLLAALDADYAMRKEEIHDEDRQRHEEQLQWIRERLMQMTGLTSMESAWRQTLESGAKLAFSMPDMTQTITSSPTVTQQFELSRLTDLTNESLKAQTETVRKLKDIDDKLGGYA
ncbi:MAG: hypothetical protein ABFD64_02910 [Armatimonadota bacterium]